MHALHCTSNVVADPCRAACSAFILSHKDVIREFNDQISTTFRQWQPVLAKLHNS